MNKRNKRLLKRNEKIVSRFVKLSDKKYKGEKLYAKKAVLVMLSTEFHLSERTIDDIVFNRIKYKQNTEL